MKKVLLSVLMCVGIMGTALSMEQPLDLMRVLELCPNEMVSTLNGASFSSLTQVCRLLHANCKAVPLKYLAITFSDAAEHGNKHLIDRYIVQPDGWMFDPEMDEEIPCENNAHDAVKIVKRAFNRGVQNFFGEFSFYCIKQGDTIARCIWLWKNDEMSEEPDTIFGGAVNFIQCDNGITLASKVCLKLFSKPSFLDHEKNMVFFMTNEFTKMNYYYELSDVLDSGEMFIQKLGSLIMLILAVQKDNAAVVCSILQSLKIPDSLLLETVMGRGSRLANWITGYARSKLIWSAMRYKETPDAVKKVIYSLLMHNNEC